MAQGLNKVQLIGNLGADPEVKVVGNNRKLTRFSLATSRTHNLKEGGATTKTEWHKVVLWSPVAEVAERYLRKGKQVYIEGELTTRSYEDGEGVKKYVTEVVGRSMILLGGRGDEVEADKDKEGDPATAQTPEEAFPF